MKIHTGAKFKSTSSKIETYTWINTTLNKFKYRHLKKKNKSTVKRYVMNITGYSEGAIDKLIARKKECGRIFVKKRTQHSFETYYVASDIALLAKETQVMLGQNGYAPKRMCRSMYLDFNNPWFEKLARISASHVPLTDAFKPFLKK